MKTKIWLPKFNPDQDFVAGRILQVGDKTLKPDQKIDKSKFTLRRLRQMYEVRWIVVATPKEKVERVAPAVAATSRVDPPPPPAPPVGVAPFYQVKKVNNVYWVTNNGKKVGSTYYTSHKLAQKAMDQLVSASA